MHQKKIVLVTAWLSLWSLEARATVMAPLDLATLVGRADQIFVARVVAQNTRWSEDKRRIVTESVVEVSEALHGAKNRQRVTLRTLGGSVDGIGMWVSGAPRLLQGQQLLAFTERRGNHRWLVGMKQGLFPIARDAKGVAWVKREISGLKLLAPKPAQTLRLPPGAGAAQLDRSYQLSALLKEIRATMASCAARSDRCLPPRLLRHAARQRPSSH